MAEKYQEDLLRFIAACQYSNLLFQSSQALLNKSFFQLSPTEQQTVINLANSVLTSHHGLLNEQTLNALAGRQQEPAGFQHRKDDQK